MRLLYRLFTELRRDSKCEKLVITYASLTNSCFFSIRHSFWKIWNNDIFSALCLLILESYYCLTNVITCLKIWSIKKPHWLKLAFENRQITWNSLGAVTRVILFALTICENSLTLSFFIWTVTLHKWKCRKKTEPYEALPVWMVSCQMWKSVLLT